ncbi:MAG: hypothetical protein IT158_11780 [Bryobacterales bacterium]|nr:hypothetical protein [Bryobacterales bacterium]
MNWIPYLVILGVLLIAVVVLLVMRKRLTSEEDDVIHVQEAESGMVAHQAVIAQKLMVVDRWGKLFTVAAVLYGLFLAGLYVYKVWMSSATTVVR